MRWTEIDKLEFDRLRSSGGAEITKGELLSGGLYVEYAGNPDIREEIVSGNGTPFASHMTKYFRLFADPD